MDLVFVSWSLPLEWSRRKRSADSSRLSRRTCATAGTVAGQAEGRFHRPRTCGPCGTPASPNQAQDLCRCASQDHAPPANSGMTALVLHAEGQPSAPVPRGLRPCGWSGEMLAGYGAANLIAGMGG